MADALWKVAGATIDPAKGGLIMGVLNVTPDSFSDGSAFFESSRAVEQGMRMAEEGAGIIDVGGESTRPGANPVPEEEELRRVIPVITKMRAAGLKSLISIDTSKADVASGALDVGEEAVAGAVEKTEVVADDAGDTSRRQCNQARVFNVRRASLSDHSR